MSDGTPIRTEKRLVATVYDETRLKHHERHAMLFLVHIASWKDHVSQHYPLRVICITEPKKVIRDTIEQLGAEIVVEEHRHFLFDKGACYNKHLAAPKDGSTERIFLTDNDTVYTGPIHEIFPDNSDAVSVSLAPKARISADMWRILINDFGARPIELSWRPEGLHAAGLRDGTEVTEERYAFFNGGAIVFPKGNDFWRRWEQKSASLSSFLAERGFDGQKSVGTDQASLSLATAEHGIWQKMPRGFNHFAFHYWLGDIRAEDVRHIHLAGIGRQYGMLDADEKKSASALIKAFWESAVIDGMDALSRTRDELDAAVGHRDYILRLIREYALENLEQFTLGSQMKTKPARKNPPQKGLFVR